MFAIFNYGHNINSRVISGSLLCLTFSLILIFSEKYFCQESHIVDSRGKEIPRELLFQISVSFTNEPFENAIHEVARKGNFHLNYNENIIPSAKKITLKIENEPAYLVLQKILLGTEIEIIMINSEQLILVKPRTSSFQPGTQLKFTISGYVTDSETGEALVGANIFIKEINAGTSTNAYGFFSLTLPADNYFIRYSYIGYQSDEKYLALYSDVKQNIELRSSSITSDTVVVVSSQDNENITSTRIGTINLLPVSLHNIPVFLGEEDILKTLQLLPGISNQREVDCGIYVRGGNADQNLLLLDEAQIYNAFHTFGFFSIFNSDAIKSINVIKGAAPAKFGGRISSVVDMQMNEGNMKELNGVAGVGLIFSRLTLQGPLLKDKASFLISARRTYFDLFTKLASSGDFKFYLYDLNAKLNYKIDDDDRIYFSGYFGRDGIGFGDELDMNWGNSTSTLRWNHLFGRKLFLNSSFIFSNFKYETSILNDNSDNDSFKYLSDVNNITLKEDFEFFADAQNTISFGANYIHHSFLPAQMSLKGDMNYRFTIGKKSADEFAFYASHEHSVNNKLKIEYGLRVVSFSMNGENDNYNFDEIEELNVDFHKAESKTYLTFEPRFSATFILEETSSLKIGLSRNYQNLHQIGNSNSGTPLDVWQPSSSNVKPQRADQISLGYFKNIYNNSIEFSVETFYKDLRNQIDYKDGANIILKNFFESELVFGRGWAYGLELLLRKNTGNLTGWVSYSASKSMRQFNEINNGRAFPAKNDKTHELNIVTQLRLSEKWVVSANWIYSSGFSTTVPYGRYYMDGKKYLAYSDRNGYRLPSYHRLDLGFSYTNDLGGTWNFSLYNAYNRHNIYTVIFREKSGSSGKMEAVKASLFGTIPSISYTLRF